MDPVDTVLVTGGAGAIGSNLAQALLRGGSRVIVLDDLSSGHFPVADTAQTRFVRGKVEDDAALDLAFAEPVTVVFHLAALFANQNSVDHPQQDLLVNGLGILKVLERAHRAGTRRFVYASSSCVYAPSEGALTESSPLGPETPYACTKLLGEQYVHFFRTHHGLSTVSLRLFNVFGPGELPGRYRNVIPNFFELARRGQDLTVTGDGTEVRTFTFIEDVVAAMLLAAGPSLPPQPVYNVASDNLCAVRNLAEKVLAVSGSKSRIVHLPRRSWDHVSVRRASWELARVDLGYQPRTTLDVGLQRTYSWLESAIRSSET